MQTASAATQGHEIDEANEIRLARLVDQAETEVDEDGYIVRIHDGEVLGMLGDAAHYPDEPFRPDTPEKAEWVLARMGEQESALVAVGARRLAILDNLARQEKAARGRLDWLHRRFDAELEILAREQLKGKKSRTFTLDHGTISIRTTKGTNRITDMAKAVAFVVGLGRRDVVRVLETVNVTDVLEVANQKLGHLEDGAAEAVHERLNAFMECSGPGEKVTISAGVLEA